MDPKPIFPRSYKKGKFRKTYTQGKYHVKLKMTICQPGERLGTATSLTVLRKKQPSQHVD